MPIFSYTPRVINDKSALTPGWHPACLMSIAIEETPPDWVMAKASPSMWRWIFAAWESPGDIGQKPPELQSTVTSAKFSPGGKQQSGKQQASKAYVFTRKLLQRPIEAGEHINLDALMPLPCQVLVSRTDKNGNPIEYANLGDVQAWPEAQEFFTPALKTYLALWFSGKRDTPESEGASAPLPAPPRPPEPPPAASAVPPWLQKPTPPPLPTTEAEAAPTTKSWRTS